MTYRECFQLDDYLDGMMTPECTQSFEGHLERCDACRQAVSFENALVQAAKESNDDVLFPVAVTVRARDAIERWQLKCRLVWTSGLAAALFAGCFFAYAFRDSGRRLNAAKSDRPNISIDREPPTSGFSTRSRVPSQQQGSDVDQPTTVRMLSDDRPRKVAVSLPTQNKNVTFVMLFPTTTAQGRVNEPGKRFDRDEAQNEVNSTPTP